jgi:predicted site-specific integrase-resolvase
MHENTSSPKEFGIKDRLLRFGFEWFEKFCHDHGASIVVMNAESLSPETEMTKDLLSSIHCFSNRLYGNG